MNSDSRELAILLLSPHGREEKGEGTAALDIKMDGRRRRGHESATASHASYASHKKEQN